MRPGHPYIYILLKLHCIHKMIPGNSKRSAQWSLLQGMSFGVVTVVVLFLFLVPFIVQV